MLFLTSTRINKMIPLPVTGRCTCQTGAAANTTAARSSMQRWSRYRSLYFRQVSSEFSDLLLFVSYFSSQNKGIQFGEYFFNVCFFPYTFASFCLTPSTPRWADVSSRIVETLVCALRLQRLISLKTLLQQFAASGVTRGFSQEGQNLAEKCPLATVVSH